MAEKETFYCYDCSEAKLKAWKGWPHKSSPIPYLETVEGNNCDTCGSERKLSNQQIFWFNVHEKHNTGLPNYWLLKIDADPWYAKWGYPYKDKMRCLKCKQPATISERRISDQKTEVKYNCEACDEVLP